MKLPKGYTIFDPADYLKTEEDIAYFLEAACEDNDPVHIAHALAAVARARGMNKVSKKSGLSRDCLYKTLAGKRKPTLDTFVRVIDALGLRLRVVPA